MPPGPTQGEARNGASKSAGTSVALAEPPETQSVTEPAESVKSAEPLEAAEPVEAAEPAPAFTPEPEQVQETSLISEPAAPQSAEDVHSAERSQPNDIQPEAIAPAPPAGPVEIRPSAANPRMASPMRAELEMAMVSPAEIPRSGAAPPAVVLHHALRLSVFEIVQPASALWRSRAGRLEIRDFARSAPLLSLPETIAAPHMDTAGQPARLTFAPSLSRGDVALWAEPPRDFRAGQIEFGEVAILDLPTTGFETSGIYESPAEFVESSPEISPLADEKPLPAEQLALPENIAAPVTVEAPVEELPAALPEIAAAPVTEPTTCATDESAATSAPEIAATEIAEPTVIGEPIPENEISSATGRLPQLTTPELAPPAALETTPALSLETVADTKSSDAVPSEAELSDVVLPETNPAEATLSEGNQIDAEPSASTAYDASALDAPPLDPNPLVATSGEASSVIPTPDAIPENIALYDADSSQSVPIEAGAVVWETSWPEPEVVAQEAEPAPEIQPPLEATLAPEPLAEREPIRLTQPIPVVLSGIPAGKAKALQIFTATLKSDIVGQIPRYESLPLRPAMVLGRVEAPPPKPEPGKAELTPQQLAKTVSAEPSKTDVAKSTEQSPRREENPSRIASEKELAELNREHARLNREQAELNRARTEANPRLVPSQAEVILRPAGPNRPLPGAELDFAEVNREQAKLNREQAELNRAQAELNREQARRNRELAKTAERIAATVPAPAAPAASPVAGAPKTESKPSLVTPTVTESKPSLVTPPVSEAAPPVEEADLGLPVLDLEAAKQRFPL